mgnify:CR=1 FL=1
MVPFIAQIQPFAFNFAPRGWTLCNGQLLPIAQFSAIFSLVGTTFGGDGRTTFGVPDLRGRSMVGVGTGPGLETRIWGERGGSNSMRLLTPHMPQHHHILYAVNDVGDKAFPGGNAIAADDTGETQYKSAATPNQPMAAGSVGNAGNGLSFDIDNPYLGLYVGFAMIGIFPSRS